MFLFMIFISNLDFFFSSLESNIVFGQGAEVMSKYGINVPRGVAVGSVEEVKKAIRDVFLNEKEVCFLFNILLIRFSVCSLKEFSNVDRQSFFFL